MIAAVNKLWVTPMFETKRPSRWGDLHQVCGTGGGGGHRVAESGLVEMLLGERDVREERGQGSRCRDAFWREPEGGGGQRAIRLSR